MKEEITQKIEEELKKINPSIEDLYRDTSSEIKKMVEKQNEEVKNQQKKEKILKVLKDAKESGINLEYSEEMSLEELDAIARNIEV